MRKWIVVINVLLPFVVSAQEEKDKTSQEKSPEEVTTGEVRLKMNSDYAKLLVDGEEWEEHEFLDKGFTLVIHGVRRTVEHKITLTPVTSDLSPVEITIKPDDWKLAPVGKNTKMWRVEKKIDFARTTGKGDPSKQEPKGKDERKQ